MSKELQLDAGNTTSRAVRGLATSGWFTRLIRGKFFGVLGHLQGAHLLIDERFDGGERKHFGPEDARIQAAVRILDPAAYVQLVFGGDIGAGEAFMDGL